MADRLPDVAEAQEGLIWGRGLTEWVPFNKWKSWIEQQEAQIETARVRLSRQWRVRIVDEDFGPMAYGDMLDVLKGRESYENIWVWTEGYKEWQNIFGFHKLMDDLGIGRRSHPRVPISGQVDIKSNKGTFSARAMSISEGGMGVAEVGGLAVGDSVHVSLKNPAFIQPLNASAEVVYIENESFAGLKFSQISSETKSMIIQYVKNHFNQSDNALA